MGNALGNAPEDHGSGLLNGFQALAQEIGVSLPKLDVVQSIMWRRDLCGARSGMRVEKRPSPSATRHMTFRLETTKELHHARVCAPHLLLYPVFPPVSQAASALAFISRPTSALDRPCPSKRAYGGMPTRRSRSANRDRSEGRPRAHLL